MIIRWQLPLIRQFLDEDQMLGGEIMGIINDQQLHSKLDQYPHECAPALAPASFEGQSQSLEKIIAQGLLAFIVFWGSYCQDRVASSRECARRETRRSD